MLIENKSIQLICLAHQVGHGSSLMALDEALLEYLRNSGEYANTLVVRTYEWAEPTLSFGVNQSDKSCLEAFLQTREKNATSIIPVVVRPTGGRAIWHEADLSFAFVTNHPDLLRLSVADAYCWLTVWIRQTLESFSVPLASSCDTDSRAYTSAALCFQSKTPSDLSLVTGEKLVGSAQLRRQGGLLQHGSAFLKSYQILPEQFGERLQQMMQQGGLSVMRQRTVQDFHLLEALWQRMQNSYDAEADKLLAKLSTTSGSHNDPDSD